MKTDKSLFTKRLFLYIYLIIISSINLAAQSVLIWSDEMEEDGLPDAEKWRYDVGGGGWGNNEEQFHTESRLQNARMEIDYVRVYDLGDTEALDTDQNDIPNSTDPDDDDDGLSDAEEHTSETNLIVKDTDGD